MLTTPKGGSACEDFAADCTASQCPHGSTLGKDTNSDLQRAQRWREGQVDAGLLGFFFFKNLFTEFCLHSIFVIRESKSRPAQQGVLMELRGQKGSPCNHSRVTSVPFNGVAQGRKHRPFEAVQKPKMTTWPGH